MVRQAEADDYLLKYLLNVSSDFKCAVGLLLGQASAHKYYVIHLAKTPPCQGEQQPAANIGHIAELNEAWIADHARQTTRMLPGGMHVLGLFVVTDEDLFTKTFSVKIKSILTAIDKTVQAEKHLFGSGDSEKLVLHLTPKNLSLLAKTYDVASSHVQPADFKFLPKINRPIGFECIYQLEHVYYLPQGEANGPLKKHIKVILDDINANLQSAVILFDNELRTSEEKLENVNKKKKMPRGSANKPSEQADVNAKPVAVTIFEKCLALEPANSVAQADVGGQIRIVGEVASKLWLHAKGTFGEAIQAVREDIMRSLATRMEMHWDSLTEEELGEDVNSVHEPPRRVFITLPESSVCVSDYLFPGEGPEDVKVSLEELLDVKADVSWELLDLEGQTDITQYYKDTSRAPENQEPKQQRTIVSDSNKFMYVLALIVAILILFVSIFVHFYMKYV